MGAVKPILFEDVNKMFLISHRIFCLIQLQFGKDNIKNCSRVMGFVELVEANYTLDVE